MVRGPAVTLAIWILCAASAAPAQPAARPRPPNQKAPSPPRATITAARIEVADPIEFQVGKAVLAAASRAILDEVAARMLASRPPIRIQVGVHTDSLGADAANLRISQERADAVRAHLLGRRVPPDRVEAKGFGERVPIASNATAQGRAQNRRVELLVITAASAPAPAPAPQIATSPPAAPPTPTQHARDLFEQGERAYNAGDFDRAIQFFLASYARVPSPALLYNIAQTYRVRGDRKLAIDYYELYLAENPKGPIAEQVRQRIAELRKAP